MIEKGIWEKMIEEYPECEKDIKGSYGYQLEMLGKAVAELHESMASALKVPIDHLVKYVREYYSFRQRVKRFLKHIFNQDKLKKL